MCKDPKAKFFAISSIINLFFLVLTAVLYMCCADQMYQMHNQLFHISRETFDTLFYGLLGIYKLFFWVFNLVPLIALLVINRCCKSSCSDDKSCGTSCKDGACCSGKDSSCCGSKCSCGCKTKALNK